VVLGFFHTENFSAMRHYLYHQRLLLLRFLLLLSAFTISRLFFYLLNIHNFELATFSDAFWLFVAGIRFDLSAALYLNLLFFIMHLIPGRFKDLNGYQLFLKLYFVIVNGLALATNFVDSKFYDFEHKRLTSDIFSSVWLGNDFKNMLPQFIKDYWYIFLAWIALVFLLWILYPRAKRKHTPGVVTSISYIWQTVLALIIMGLGVLSARGGLQMKPLRIITAATYTSAQNVALVLNSPFTILQTLKKKEISGRIYFKNKADILSYYNPVQQFDTTSARWKKPNVVIFILESFSSEYTGFFGAEGDYTPFLDSIAAHSWAFQNAYANGKRSIEAVPSILASIPALMDDPFITTRYGSNRINTLPEFLGEMGYNSSFFHGGHNGTMGFDTFAADAGIQKYYGKNEYTGPDAEDGGWGIYDEEFLQYFSKMLTTFKQPFFSAVFTLSSHHPYTVPDRYTGVFPTGKLPILQTIAYADYSIRRFFEAAKKTSWYNHTLFIFTADHTAQPMGEYYGNKVGNYDIPIMFYYPGDSTFHGVSYTVAQQADIMPSVLQLVGCKRPFVGYGTSLFDSTAQHFAVNYISGIYQLIDGNFDLQFNGEKALALYNYRKDSLLKNNLLKALPDTANLMENRLKAIIQGYEQNLDKNTLYVKDTLK